MIQVTHQPLGQRMRLNALGLTKRFKHPKPEAVRVFEKGAKALGENDTDSATKASARLLVLRTVHNDHQAGRLFQLLTVAILTKEIAKARTTRRHNTRRAVV
ncbi:MAG: hypothetical protein ACQEW7_12465 [Pseudomonadota bacterium]